MDASIKSDRERERAALILRGAREVFERDGHDGVSIRKVARAIGYSPGTIYLYYKDKGALMTALHEDAFFRERERFAPLMIVRDPMERLEAMGRTYIKSALERPSDFHLMFVDDCYLASFRERGQEWYTNNGSFLLLVQTIQEGIDVGRFRENIEAESMAVTLWSMVHGYTTLALSGRLGMLPEERQRSAEDDMFAQVTELLLPRDSTTD